MSNITDRMLLEACQLTTLKNIEEFIDKKVMEIVEVSLTNISNCTVIKANNPYMFGALALKIDKDIIISYASSGSLSDVMDWIGNLKSLYRAHPYTEEAIEFARTIIDKYQDISTIYIAGGSLGGHLAQAVAYNLYNNFNIKNIKVTTFNSLGFTAPNHIKDKYQLPILKNIFIAYSTIFILKFILKKSILSRLKNISSIIKIYSTLENKILSMGGLIDKSNPIWDSFGLEIEDVVINYYIDADPVYTILSTKNIGKEVIIQSSYIKGLLKDGIKAHNLNNFIDKI